MSQSSAVAERDKERAGDVLERVTLAIRSLCVGKGDVRSRLEEAITYQLLPLREEDFPCGLRGKFREIMEQSTKYDASDRYRARVHSIGGAVSGTQAVRRFYSFHNEEDSSINRRKDCS